MYFTTLLTITAATAIPFLTSAFQTSPKRGLCYVPSDKHPSDDQIWTSGPVNPSWYYNYQYTPSPAYAANKDMQFVPMLWGASSSDTGTPFYDAVKRQIDSGANITYALSFNEPNEAHSNGGSNLAAPLAAARWKAEIEPLKKLGVKVGAPAVTGAASGWTWLDNFFDACGAGGCNPDFMTVHWYGNYEGMMSHVGRTAAKWPNTTIWVTEFGYANQDLKTSQDFYSMSSESFDRWGAVTHYAYFGAFRSDVSNVGKNAAMLTEKGELTDIGSWYMGGVATHNVPQSSASRSVLGGEVYMWMACLSVAVVWLYALLV